MPDLPPVVIPAHLILPVPGQLTALGPASIGTRIKKLGTIILGAGLFAGISAALYAVLWHWLGYIGYGISALLFVVGVKGALTGKVAPCPFCGALLGSDAGEDDLAVQDEPQTLWCKSCGEYVTLVKGELRAHDPSTVAEEPTFKSHVFKGGVWPPACVHCGADPVRRDNLKTTDVSGAALLVGRLSVSSGSVAGVPYCEAHKEAVKLSIDDDQLQLTWQSLPMLRQYLAANRKAGNTEVVK